MSFIALEIYILKIYFCSSKGLQFLHESHFEYHGNLKSSNVVIDGRWVCKVTDYGLHELTQGADTEEESAHSKYSSKISRWFTCDSNCFLS